MPCELVQQSDGDDSCSAVYQCNAGRIEATCQAIEDSDRWDCACSGDLGAGTATLISRSCQAGTVACIDALTRDDPPNTCETLHQGRSNAWCEARRICQVEADDGVLGGEHRRTTSCRRSEDDELWDCSCETPTGAVNVSVDFGDDDYPCPRFLNVCDALAKQPTRQQCEVVFEGNDRTSCELEAECRLILDGVDGTTLVGTTRAHIGCSQVEPGQWYCPCFDGWLGDLGDPRNTCRAAANRCLTPSARPLTPR